ncbi:cytoplasmic tRNA 2-thiolation protein 2 [Trichoplusia ni]|uniref:Cytoplasmic tRNA 2-thiolation protein 2 n=1 Tax=Trichoplusia ni TaxID=7111 RepID=A0A7E5VSG3_TRINI|nr:cytoplasmic tRNA 2-thiolation protein 2 [Trichoplusia ni]
MPATAANDYLLKIKRDLFLKYAKKLNCTAIFTAETTNTLAINLLCNIAIGRGSQVQNDVGFCDIRDDQVKILRPMKDIGKEELDYYMKIKKLDPVFKKNVKSSSLQSAIASFVSDLQENFQSTISTVCKTADKIGDYDADKASRKCRICKSDLNKKNMKLSALEATNISKTVSFGNRHFKQDLEKNSELLSMLENDTQNMFPLIYKHLCYGCSRNHSEMSKPELLHIG